jgi:hypothetical protein
LAFYLEDVGIGKNLDIWVLVVLNISWGYGWSCTTIAVIASSTTEDTIVLWEHEAKLGDSPSKAGCLLNQVNLQSRVGQVKCGAHTPDAAAHNQGRGWFTMEIPGRHSLH